MGGGERGRIPHVDSWSWAEPTQQHIIAKVLTNDKVVIHWYGEMIWLVSRFVTEVCIMTLTANLEPICYILNPKF
jgi:hypothetical protein